MEVVEKRFVYKGLNFPVKAQVVGERLMSIYEKENCVTPDLVLEDAKKKNSPLHSCFEWDDTEAAKKYRLTQARDLIRSVKVVETTLDDKEIIVRNFVNIQVDKDNVLTNNFFKKNGGASYYVTTSDAMRSDVLKKHTLDMAFNELNNFMEKYRSLNDLSELFDVINEFIKKKSK